MYMQYVLKKTINLHSLSLITASLSGYGFFHVFVYLGR